MSKCDRSALTTARSCLFTLSLFACSACSVSIADETVTTDSVAQVRKDVENSASLSDADKKLFAQALNREGYIPYGKSVVKIIDEETSLNTKEAMEAEASAQAAADDKSALQSISIAPYSIVVKRGVSQFTGSDEPFSDIDELEFSVKNLGKKTVASFTASTLLTDKGGGRIFSGDLVDAELIPPGSSIILKVEHKPDIVYDEQVNARNTSIDQAVARASVSEITFSDGSKVSDQ